jgi:riboflavin kinase/FMN adenylyltransferase
MKVFESLEQYPSRGRPAAVSIGNFDGVHRGHLGIIRRLRAHADRQDAAATIVTFDPHPQKVLRGEAPEALTTFERKLKLLDEAGIDQTVVLHFTRSLSLVEPEDFIERILFRRLRAKALVEGSIFRFGHMARGDSTMLRRFGRKLGYAFEAVRVSELGGRLVSSTEIRYAIREGDLRWANRALGRPHRLPGKVVRSSGRGRRLGFPTANLKVPPGLCLPKLGIYAGYLNFDGERRPAAISVGTNPTFGKNPLSVEAYVLDFEGDLGGREVALDLVAWIRDEEAFPDPETLAQAISSDVTQTRRLLRRHGRGPA